MIEVTGQQRLCKARLISGGMALFLMICLVVFSGCSSTPQDHPLLTDTPTVEQGTPGTATTITGSNIPVSVIGSQSSLTTYPGGNMNMTVATSPYAICNFLVSYGQSKPSTTSGIVPRTADAKGMVSWTWQVDGGAHTGTWPLMLSATLPGGAHTTTRINVNVTLAPITVLTSQSVLSSPPKGIFTVTISTAPSVACTITWNYGPGTPTKTYRASANKSGIAAWTWHVDRSAPAGTWRATIIATLFDGETSSNAVDLTVLP